MTEIEKLDAMLTELHVNHDLHRRFDDNGVEGWLTAEQVVEMARKAAGK